MFIKTYSAAVNGLDVSNITVETYIEVGTFLCLSGLGDEAIRESQSRIRTAFAQSGFRFPNKQITINLSPANLRKEGSGYDLPIAIGILAANEDMIADHLHEYMLVGELGLDGKLKPVKGALPIAILARKEKFKGLIVPKENEYEAAVVNNLEVYGMDSLLEVVQFLSDQREAEPLVFDTRKMFYEQQSSFEMDFSDVRGQENVKRAMEVAAAGGHNLIMVGPPGAGKSMMAKRLPTILPPLSLSESLETTQIHSVAGKLATRQALISQRPFRSPHHTISQVALVGGGNSPQPGEISLAHNGVLFADELPEFSKSTLEVLRQPLEDRKITIARAKYTTEYPCSFMFVASANPCPCGYYGDATHDCICTPSQRHRYMSKISGPLMDRIDIQCEIQPVPFEEISKQAEGEKSAVIRERVIAARKIQEQRFAEYNAKLSKKATSGNGAIISAIHCNAQMNDRMIHEYCEPDEQGMEILRTAMQRFSLSARAYSRILKVARTIADLAGEEKVSMNHIAEAIQYRQLDRADWCDRL